MKVGDTVRLKSNGPLMTVNFVEDETVKCHWFDKDESLKDGVFHKDQLEEESDEPYVGDFND